MNTKESVIIKLGKKWYKFYEPFECICCRKEISKQQFCFSMLCGYCDLGKCQKNWKYEEGHGKKVKDLIKDKGELVINLSILENLE